MATIFKKEHRKFEENPGRVDPFRLCSDVSKVKRGINPRNLNFDLRQLNPQQFSSLYHFHRNAEELFLVLSGSMTLRTPQGLEVVHEGDLVFFEIGETGAHQFFNHTSEPCVYLDVRTFLDVDVCEYPDSGKILIAPTFDVFSKEPRLGLFDGEEQVTEKWKELEEGSQP